MSASVELQTLILNRLLAFPAVAAIVGNRVFDGKPEGEAYPSITFGPSDHRPEDADCIPARGETLQLDCWTQAGGRQWPARELADAVKAALHGYTGDLGTNALVSLEVDMVRVFRDPDGITSHGVVRCNALIEERA